MQAMDDVPPDEQRRTLRRVTARVLIVQLAAMLLLWALHARYHAG